MRVLPAAVSQVFESVMSGNTISSCKMMEGFTKRTQLLQRSINPFDRQSIRHRPRRPSALTFAAPAFRCAVCTRHGLIIYVAAQPPNDKVLWITLALLVRAAIIWYPFEKQALRGSVDQRHDQEVSGRDPGGREGRPQNSTLTNVAYAAFVGPSPARAQF